MTPIPPIFPKLSIVRLVITDDALPVGGATARLSEEFPTVRIEIGLRSSDGDVVVEAQRWSNGAGFAEVDATMYDAIASSKPTSERGMSVRGPVDVLEHVALEALTRCQRFLDRRNMASSFWVWDAVRVAHADLYDFSKSSSVASDYDHAVDTWQWLIRLEPDAGFAVQIAALFHDLIGADVAEILKQAGVSDALTKQTCSILAAQHESRSDVRTRGYSTTMDVDLLNDADALSFFSLQCPRYADTFGPERTKKRIFETLKRLRRPALTRILTTVRLRQDVRSHVLAFLNGT